MGSALCPGSSSLGSSSLFQALGSWERKKGRAREKIREVLALVLPRFFSSFSLQRTWNRLGFKPRPGTLFFSWTRQLTLTQMYKWVPAN